MSDPFNPPPVPVPLPPPVKPGWQTTEFWTSLIPQAFALLVLTGMISPGDRATLEGAVTNGMASIAALAASAFTIWRYVAARQSVKEIHAAVSLQKHD